MEKTYEIERLNEFRFRIIHSILPFIIKDGIIVWTGNWFKPIQIKEEKIKERFLKFDDGWSYQNYWTLWKENWEFIEIVGKPKKKLKPRLNSFVVFDKTTVSEDIYNKYYKQTFENEFNGKNELFIFLGEVPNASSHCILADLYTGKILGLYHTYNFREATENET